MLKWTTTRTLNNSDNANTNTFSSSDKAVANHVSSLGDQFTSVPRLASTSFGENVTPALLHQSKESLHHVSSLGDQFTNVPRLASTSFGENVTPASVHQSKESLQISVPVETYILSSGPSSPQVSRQVSLTSNGSSSISQGDRISSAERGDGFRKSKSKSLPSSPRNELSNLSINDRLKKSGVLNKFKNLFRKGSSVKKDGQICESNISLVTKFSPARARKLPISSNSKHDEDGTNQKDISGSKTRLTRLIEAKRDDRKLARSNIGVHKSKEILVQKVPHRSASINSVEEHNYVQHSKLDKSLFFQGGPKSISDALDRWNSEFTARTFQENTDRMSSHDNQQQTISIPKNTPFTDLGTPPRYPRKPNFLNRSSSLRSTADIPDSHCRNKEIHNMKNPDGSAQTINQRRWSSQHMHIDLPENNGSVNLAVSGVMSGHEKTLQLSSKDRSSDESLFTFGESLTSMITSGNFKKVKVMPSNPDMIIQARSSLSPVCKDMPSNIRKTGPIKHETKTVEPADKFLWSLTDDGSMLLIPATEVSSNQNIDQKRSDLFLDSHISLPKNNNNGHGNIHEGFSKSCHNLTETSDFLRGMIKRSVLNTGEEKQLKTIPALNEDRNESMLSDWDNRNDIGSYDYPLRSNLLTNEKCDVSISRQRVSQIVRSLEKQCDGSFRPASPHQAQKVQSCGEGNNTVEEEIDMHRKVHDGNNEAIAVNSAEITFDWEKKTEPDLKNEQNFRSSKDLITTQKETDFTSKQKVTGSINDKMDTYSTIHRKLFTHGGSSCESEGFSPKICSTFSEGKSSFPDTSFRNVTRHVKSDIHQSIYQNEPIDSPSDTEAYSGSSPQSSGIPSIHTDTENDTQSFHSDLQGVFSDSSNVDSLAHNTALTENKISKNAGKSPTAKPNFETHQNDTENDKVSEKQKQKSDNIDTAQEMVTFAKVMDKRKLSSPRDDSLNPHNVSCIDDLTSTGDQEEEIIDKKVSISTIMQNSSSLEECITDVRAPASIVLHDSSPIEEDNTTIRTSTLLHDSTLIEKVFTNGNVPAINLHESSTLEERATNEKKKSSIIQQEYSLVEENQGDAVKRITDNPLVAISAPKLDIERKTHEKIRKGSLLSAVDIQYSQTTNVKTQNEQIKNIQSQREQIKSPKKQGQLESVKSQHGKGESVKSQHGKGESTKPQHGKGESIKPQHRTGESVKSQHGLEKSIKKHEQVEYVKPQHGQVASLKSQQEQAEYEQIQLEKVESKKTQNSIEQMIKPTQSSDFRTLLPNVVNEIGALSAKEKDVLKVKPKKKVSFNLDIPPFEQLSSSSDVAVMEITPCYKVAASDKLRSSKDGICNEDCVENDSSTDVSCSFSLRSNEAQGAACTVASTSGEDFSWWGPEIVDNIEFFHDRKDAPVGTETEVTNVADRPGHCGEIDSTEYPESIQSDETKLLKSPFSIINTDLVIGADFTDSNMLSAKGKDICAWLQRREGVFETVGSTDICRVTDKRTEEDSERSVYVQVKKNETSTNSGERLKCVLNKLEIVITEHAITEPAINEPAVNETDISDDDNSYSSNANLRNYEGKKSISETDTRTYDVSSTLAKAQKVMIPWWQKPVEAADNDNSHGDFMIINEDSSNVSDTGNQQLQSHSVISLSDCKSDSSLIDVTGNGDGKQYNGTLDLTLKNEGQSLCTAKKSADILVCETNKTEYCEHTSTQKVGKHRSEELNSKCSKTANNRVINSAASAEVTSYIESNNLEKLPQRNRQENFMIKRRRFLLQKLKTENNVPSTFKKTKQHLQASLENQKKQLSFDECNRKIENNPNNDREQQACNQSSKASQTNKVFAQKTTQTKLDENKKPCSYENASPSKNKTRSNPLVEKVAKTKISPKIKCKRVQIVVDDESDSEDFWESEEELTLGVTHCSVENLCKQASNSLERATINSWKTLGYASPLQENVTKIQPAAVSEKKRGHIGIVRRNKPESAFHRKATPCSPENQETSANFDKSRLLHFNNDVRDKNACPDVGHVKRRKSPCGSKSSRESFRCSESDNCPSHAGQIRENLTQPRLNLNGRVYKEVPRIPSPNIQFPSNCSGQQTQQFDIHHRLDTQVGKSEKQHCSKRRSHTTTQHKSKLDNQPGQWLFIATFFIFQLFLHWLYAH